MYAWYIFNCRPFHSWWKPCSNTALLGRERFLHLNCSSPAISPANKNPGLLFSIVAKCKQSSKSPFSMNSSVVMVLLLSCIRSSAGGISTQQRYMGPRRPLVKLWQWRGRRKALQSKGETSFSLLSSGAVTTTIPSLRSKNLYSKHPLFVRFP